MIPLPTMQTYIDLTPNSGVLLPVQLTLYGRYLNHAGSLLQLVEAMSPPSDLVRAVTTTKTHISTK